MLRHLAQRLAADMPGTLRQTARLRYHRARHVRQLAAQSMGFLLRHARGKALRAGIRTIYAGALPMYLHSGVIPLLVSCQDARASKEKLQVLLTSVKACAWSVHSLGRACDSGLCAQSML